MFLKQQGVGWLEYSALVAFLQIFLVFLIIESSLGEKQDSVFES